MQLAEETGTQCLHLTQVTSNWYFGALVAHGLHPMLAVTVLFGYCALSEREGRLQLYDIGSSDHLHACSMVRIHVES